MTVGIFERIELGVYPFGIYLSIAQGDTEFLCSLVESDLIIPKDFIEDDKYYAKVWQSLEGYVIFRIKHYPENNYQLGAISHDALHATLRVMETVGCTLNDGSEEAYAYLLGYIVEQVNELIEIRLKELSLFLP